ncbi:MAG: TetR/AcrR family transcriptional regulator [Nocardiaceae bacterium]|nr:TetR/AcrR family transcriptional regulator [Nocardiaceae bacterium]
MGPDARRTDIMSAAIRLFGERPYGDVSIAEVAQEAGVARALVNHYCGTKRELYLSVVRQVVTPPNPEEFTLLPGGTLADRVDLLVDWLLTTIASYGRTWVTVVGAEGIAADAELAQILDDADRTAADLVLDAVEFNGGAESRRSAHIAVLCFGALAKATAREWIIKQTLTREHAHRLLTTTLVAILDDTPDLAYFPEAQSNGH